MFKLLTIIGARPQIIKAAALSRAVKNEFSGLIEEKILHTGQHYDENMSQVFFDELGIPMPDYNLNVGSGSHGAQTAKMIEGIEGVLKSEYFDGLVVYGDTNSTLAGAVAAAKLHIPIFHIEAGLRSFNMSMPEEVNRIMCDHVSSILFAPTETGMKNIKNEGLVGSLAQFKNGKGRWVVNSGDIMYDNSVYFAEIAEKKSFILNEYSLEKCNYVLATIHRDNNTDVRERLSAIFRALLDIAEGEGLDVVLPLHPRTKKLLSTNLSKELFDKVYNSEFLKIIPPASFLEMIVLEKNAKLVMTDSGGVQKEAYFFKKPCVILRPETEWVEILEQGAGVLADADYDRIMDGYRVLSGREVVFPNIFGDGDASSKILNSIVEYLK